VIHKFTEDCGIPRSDHGMDGELKLASFGSSLKNCSMPGCAEIVHLHALDGVLVVPPPPR
jgi:hypothetical protein